MKTKIFRNLTVVLTPNPLSRGERGRLLPSPSGEGPGVRMLLGWGLLLCLLLTASCIKNVDEPLQTIVLAAPEENLYFDLDALQSITFKWSAVSGVDKYRIAFSLNEDMIPSTAVDAATSPYAMPAEELDGALKKLNMPAGATATVYWSVRSNPILMNIITQVRALELTRKQ